MSIFRRINSIIIALLLFTNVSFAGFDGCADGILVVSSNNQGTLDKKISTCTDAKAVHLSLTATVQYNFDAFREFENLEYLTIEFPGRNDLGVEFDYGARSINYLDCSFLSYLTSLKFLVIDWGGEVLNIESITEVPNLLYARLPITAFHPRLFSDETSIVQYEFGDQLRLVFTKRESIKPLVVPFNHYDEYCRSLGKKLNRFGKKASKVNGKMNSWGGFQRLSGQGDLLEVNELEHGITEWNVNNDGNGYQIIGSYNQADSTLEQVFKGPNYERTVLKKENFISITELQKYEIGEKENTTINKVGFKNGVMHGIFSKVKNGETLEEKLMENGTLRYSYRYSDSLPKFDTRTLVSYRLSAINRSYKEYYFEKNGELEVINVLSAPKGNPNTTLLAIIHLKDGLLHGDLSIYNELQDTLCYVVYNEGVLNGKVITFQYGEDIIRNEGYFDNNKLTGRFTSKGEKNTTIIQEYKNDVIIWAVIRRNSDGFILQEMRWIEKDQCTETKYWGEDKVLRRVLRQNSNGKVIEDKQMVKTSETNMLPPP